MRFREKQCPVCGRVGRFHTYCSRACKQKAYRNRLQSEQIHKVRQVSTKLERDLSTQEFHMVCELLNQVTSRRQSKAVSQAVLIIVDAYREKINLEKRNVNRREHAVKSAIASR